MIIAIIILCCLVAFFIFSSVNDSKIIREELSPISLFPGNYNVRLISAGANKIAVLKEIRIITGLGLKEAKYLIDSAPSVVCPDIDENSAAAVKQRLEEAGATVEIV